MSIKNNRMVEKNIQNRSILLVLILALFLRVVHLGSSVANPMTYHHGADEAYYINFGKDVVSGQLGMSDLYVFMDPLYGYISGFFIWATGLNLFSLYVFQIIVDVFTVSIVYSIGKGLWNHRAGLIAAVLYALTSTAIFYTVTFLKPTLVANYIALWVFLSINVPKIKSPLAWLGYGLFLGVGVSLRSNLLLLSIASAFLMPFLHFKSSGKDGLSLKIVLLLLGFSLPGIMLAGRNAHVTNHWSMLPPNSGIVLHQLYNSHNPNSVQFSPAFVSYSSPPEILAGYTRETEKKVGQQLSIYEVSSFWRKQALTYIASNSDKIIENIIRKTKEFIAFKELENSRFINRERIFSPLLEVLPNPFGWLFALGLPGLVLIVLRNKYFSLPIIIAVSTVFVTFIIFIAAARFRAHGLPLFAVGSGVFITALIDWKNTGKNKTIALISLSIILGVLTIVSGKHINNVTVIPMEFAWGYLKMGEPEQARKFAEYQIDIDPENPDPHELLGYMALNNKQYKQAILSLNNAIRFAPQHHETQYNLAISYRKNEQFEKSLLAIESAINYIVLPEYLYLKGQVLEEIGDIKNAVSTYIYLIEIAKPDNNWQSNVTSAQERLRFLKY